MVRAVLVFGALLGSVQMVQACLNPGEEVYDPGEYVARFYECPSLADVGDLALTDELLARWNRAAENGLIDQPFVIMGNDYDLTELSVLEHEVRPINPRSIEIVVRATFRNFGEPQAVDWLFHDDLTDEGPLELIDIQGVSPFTYSLAEILRSFGK
jgi:hypothetical protein